MQHGGARRIEGRLAGTVGLALLITVVPHLSSAAVVTLAAGQDVQAAVDAAAAGDTVRLAYAPEGGAVPTEFSTKPESKQLMFVMKKKEQ